jgi:hypothetical protein
LPRRERLGDGRGFISQTIDVTHERDRAIESRLEDVHRRMIGPEARIERQQHGSDYTRQQNTQDRDRYLSLEVS